MGDGPRPGPPVADLTPRIEHLLGELAGHRAGGTAPAASESLPELRPGDAGFTDAVARLVAMPLDLYAREGAPLEIRVPWCPESLWLVPGDADAELLGREGVGRGRIWTAMELMAVMALPEWSPEIARRLALAKREMDGDIVEVRRRGP